MKASVLAVLLLWAGTAWPFPEMVRHGYMNCTSCHVSPNGGGILNPYGRVQAEEVLSMFSAEGEGGVLHGALPSTGAVSLGGQFRALQLWTESQTLTEHVRSGRFIVMQADLEVGIQTGPLQWVGTVGLGRNQSFLSRRHYVLWRPHDESSWVFRAGRFLPAFGLNLADHAIATRDGLGFGQTMESYNLETAWLGEDFDAFATLVLGKLQGLSEQGVALRAAWNATTRAKLGWCYFLGRTPNQHRHVAGPYAIWGFSEAFFLLLELDWQWVVQPVGVTSGPVFYSRLNYEVSQGLHTYLTADYSRSATPSSTQTGSAYGVGVQFFPRPHLELRTEYSIRNDQRTQFVSTHYGWLMFHYYL